MHCGICVITCVLSRNVLKVSGHGEMAANATSNFCVHGWQDGSVCLCDIAYTGVHCDVSNNFESAKSLYYGYLWAFRVAFGLLAIISIFRLIIVTMALKSLSPRTQTVSLSLCVIGTVIGTAWSADPQGHEHVWSRKIAFFLNLLQFVFAVAACAVLVRFFVNLQIKFHAPTRKARLLLDAVNFICFSGSFAASFAEISSEINSNDKCVQCVHCCLGLVFNLWLFCIPRNHFALRDTHARHAYSSQPCTKAKHSAADSICSMGASGWFCQRRAHYHQCCAAT